MGKEDDLWCDTCKDQWPIGHTHAPELNFIETYERRLFIDTGGKQMEKSEVIRNMDDYISQAQLFKDLPWEKQRSAVAIQHIVNLLEIVDHLLEDIANRAKANVRLEMDLRDAEETLKRIEQSNILQAVKSYFSRKEWRASGTPDLKTTDKSTDIASSSEVK